MLRVSSQRGQASVEYAAVVAVAAAVLAAAVALLGPAGLGAHVLAAWRRALCVVSGGPCDDVPRACVLRADQHADGGHLNLLVLRLGGRSVELLEQRADGTVAMTLVDEGSGGLDVGSGVELHVRWGTRSWAAGAELRAAILASRSSGRTWIVHDLAAARALAGRVRLADRTRRPRPDIPASPSMAPMPAEVHAPAPAQTFTEHAGELSLDAQAGSGRAALHLDGRQTEGERIDRATGQRTVYVRWTGSARGSVRMGGAGLAGDGSGEERYGISFDRRGRPLDFEVLSALDVTGSATLPATLAATAGQLGIPLHGERHVETERHLDLTDPVNAQEVQEYLRLFGSGNGVLEPLQEALRGRIDRLGTTSVRTYAASFSAHEVGGQARIGGIGVGGEAGSEDSSARLLAALARTGEGPWVPDATCVARG